MDKVEDTTTVQATLSNNKFTQFSMDFTVIGMNSDSPRIIGITQHGVEYTLVRADEPLLARVKQLESFLIE